MNHFNNKTVLVTGATGLIGTHIVKRLLQSEGCHIIALGRDIHKLEEVFEGYRGKGTLTLRQGNMAVATPSFGCPIDYIFHAASPTSLDDIHNIPVDVIHSNVLGTINCLEFLKKQREEQGIAGEMVLFSSVRIYANPTSDDYRVKEDETRLTTALDTPIAAYAESKRMIEVIAHSYAKQYGMKVHIARFSTVYGYCLKAPDTAFFEFINKSLRGEDLLLNSNGAPRRDNIYVEDAVDGIFCMVEKGVPDEAYNISSGGDKDGFAAVDEIAEAIATASNQMKDQHITIAFREEKASRATGLILDNHKLKSLGWEVTTSLVEGMEKTLQQY